MKTELTEQGEQNEEREPAEQNEPLEAELTEDAQQSSLSEQAEVPEQSDETQSGKKKKPLAKAVRKLFAPLTRILDGIEHDFEDRSYFKKTLLAMFKLRVPICILLAVVIAASGCYFLIESRNTATAEMSLNYEESANGLNPNSTRFNAYEFTSPEVIEGMVSACGIDPDTVDLNALANAIYIRPTNAKAFSEENFFISTSYRITFKKPPSLKSVRTSDLLALLCKSYKDYLFSRYTENRSILYFDIDEFKAKEFMEIADLLDLKAQQIETYLNTRVKQSKTFTEKQSEETFKSLQQKVEDLRAYDIAKYRVFVIQSGTSHDKAGYIRALSYVNRMKTISYNKDMASYTVRNDGIIMYDESMISVVMIPSIDDTKNTFYMSKTKTGMDYMAAQADDYLATAQETSKEITVNKDIIQKMRAGENKAADIRKANRMIEDIRQKFSDLSRQIETVDKAYIQYRTKDYLTFKPGTTSLMQRLRPDVLAAAAAVMLLGIFAVLWLRFRYFYGGKKRERVSVITLPFQG